MKSVLWDTTEVKNNEVDPAAQKLRTHHDR